MPFKYRFQFLLKTLPFHLGFGLWFLIPGLSISFLSFAPIGATLNHVDLQKREVCSTNRRID
jgi:CysZ protein